MTCRFCLPHTITDHPEFDAIQENFEYAADIASALDNDPDATNNSPLVGFGGSAVAGTYDTDYIATEETQAGSNPGAWADLATVGPTVSVDIPTNSLVFFTASVIMWNTTIGSAMRCRLVNTSGNFNIQTGLSATLTYSPGMSNQANAAPTYPTMLNSNQVWSDTFAAGPNNYRSPPMFFYAGSALTGESFKLEYSARFGTGRWKERRLSVLVIALT